MLEKLTRFRPFQSAARAERIARGVQVRVDDEFLRIEAIRGDIVRLKLSRGGVFDERPTAAVVADPSETPPFTLSGEGNAVRLTTEHVSVLAARDPFGIDIRRTDGSSVLRGCTISACGISGPAVPGRRVQPVGETSTTGQDVPATARDIAEAEQTPYELLVGRHYGADDAIYGLGQKTGGLNRRGRDYRLWNTDILHLLPKGDDAPPPGTLAPADDPTSLSFDPYYISIPFFCHLDAATAKAAGFFVDNGFEGHFSFSAPNRYEFRFAGGQYTEYVLAGPDLRHILEAYTWLTGRMQLPPLWALGHHQCRWHPFDEHGIADLAARYRESGIPCDSLWLDIDYMDGFRVFTWDNKRFPAPADLISRLHDQGFRAVTIIDPGVKAEKGYGVFDEGHGRGLFCQTETEDLYIGQVWPGRTAFPDFVRSEVRTWWAGHISGHLQHGVDGIWIDMNEPATGKVEERGMRFDRGKYSHERFHNQYALFMARATVEGAQKARPRQRPFVLSRAGSAGIQRYCANWLGDNCSRWEHLWMSMPMAMGLGLSGQPFVGADAGGFAEDTSGELLARWYQHGALSPFFRNHASRGTVEQYPWSFGPRVEAVCRKAVRLRYRLLPYLYTAFQRTSVTGEPIQAPMVFAFQHDGRARELDDQYLLGRHLLVAPIYRLGAEGRAVYLPKGTWYDWYSGNALQGPQTVRVGAPLSHIPLFVRGGAVIPMLASAPPSTGGLDLETVELHVFAPLEDGDAVSWLYEDDGSSLDYREGAYLLTEMVMRRQGQQLTLAASVSGGGYPGRRRQALAIVAHTPLEHVRIDGRARAFEDNRLLLENRGNGFEISASLPPPEAEPAKR